MSAVEHTIDVRRSARYFTLGDDESDEVWLVLHGYGHLAAEFIEHFGSISEECFVIAPEGLSRFYSQDHKRVGASWMTREDREAEIADYLVYLDAVHLQACRKNARLTVLGFSQGAHTACRWAASGPKVDRLILWGSGLPKDLNERGLLKSVGDTGITIVVGSGDRYLGEEDLEAEVERANEMGIQARIVRFDGGHEIDAEVLERVASGH